MTHQELIWIITGALIALAFISKATCDTLDFHFENSIFNTPNRIHFFGPSSWSNCYKNNNVLSGPKFLGSTTCFIWLTSGWHLFDFIRSISLIAAIFINVYGTFTEALLYGFVMFMVGSLIFELFYSKLLKKK